MTAESDLTPAECMFRFSTTDLTFRQMAALGQHSECLRDGRTWEGWSWFRRVAMERLVDRNDSERFDAVPFKYFQSVKEQFIAALTAGDKLRELEKGLDKSSEDTKDKA